MPKYVLSSVFIVALGGLIYLLGRKDCHNQYLASYQEQKENVTFQKAKIYTSPNASRDTLLKLMREGSL